MTVLSCISLYLVKWWWFIENKKYIRKNELTFVPMTVWNTVVHGLSLSHNSNWEDGVQ